MDEEEEDAIKQMRKTRASDDSGRSSFVLEAACALKLVKQLKGAPIGQRSRGRPEAVRLRMRMRFQRPSPLTAQVSFTRSSPQKALRAFR